MSGWVGLGCVCFGTSVVTLTALLRSSLEVAFGLDCGWLGIEFEAWIGIVLRSGRVGGDTWLNRGGICCDSCGLRVG